VPKTDLERFAELIVDWASSSRNHGGNPYAIDFVRTAQNICGEPMVAHPDPCKRCSLGSCRVPCTTKYTAIHIENQRVLL
jgi:hypothetical protein